MSNNREIARTWQAVIGRLQVDITRANFETFVVPTRAVRFDDGCLQVETPHALHLGMLNDSIRQSARMALLAITGEEIDVAFVAAGLEGGGNAAGPSGVHDGEISMDASPPAGGVVLGTVNRRFSLDAYLPASGNRLAISACLSLIEGVDPPESVAVWGAPGLGKTHLLHGLAMRAAQAGLTTACLSAEDFTSGFQRALKAQDVDAFHQRMRGVNLLIIDDLQEFAGKVRTQEVLVHTVDSVLNAGGHIVVAGEVHPVELDLPDRLRTRFAAGVVANILPFQSPERRGFVECVARNLRASLPAWAIERIVALGDVPVRIIKGAVSTAVALQRDESLDMANLDLALAKLIVLGHTTRETSAADIICAVAAHYGATVDEIRGRTRRADALKARAVAAAALKARGLSLTRVGEELGGRDRSTLSVVVKRGQKLLEADPSLRARLAG